MGMERKSDTAPEEDGRQRASLCDPNRPPGRQGDEDGIRASEDGKGVPIVRGGPAFTLAAARPVRRASLVPLAGYPSRDVRLDRDRHDAQ